MFEGACMGFCASLGGGFCYRVATAVHCPPIEQHPNLCVPSLEHLSADATSGPNVMISHIYMVLRTQVINILGDLGGLSLAYTSRF